MSTVTLFHRRQRMNKKQAAGIATGAAIVGAATAILLTPKPGKEMRGHAVNGVRRAKHQAGRLARKTTQGVQDKRAHGGVDSEQWSDSNQDSLPEPTPASLDS